MKFSKKARLAQKLSLLIIGLSLIIFFIVDPIPQDSKYHEFVDQNPMLGVNHFWNVASNIPFMLVAMIALFNFKTLVLIHPMKIAYLIFFIGIFLVGIGSSYYHMNPSNGTLVWDRMPMTIGFMALIAIIIAEYISIRLAKKLLVPLILIGFSSVIYWQYTESIGLGDLRFYALVQFLPIILIPLIISTHTSKFSATNGYWHLLAAYVLAKFLEHFDSQIYSLLSHTISGHSLKHVMAALGIYFLFSNYKNRAYIN